MKTIKFNEAELDFLQSHYELELLDAENYVAEIKNILKKLGVVEKEVTREKAVKTSAKKRGRPAKEKTPVAETVPAPVLEPATKTPGPKVPVKKAPAKKVTKKATKPVRKSVKPVAVAATALPESQKPE